MQCFQVVGVVTADGHIRNTQRYFMTRSGAKEWADNMVEFWGFTLHGIYDGEIVRDASGMFCFKQAGGDMMEPLT